MSLKVGDRVSTDTKWEQVGVGSGVIIGVEVPDSSRPGHLRNECDPDLANPILEKEEWARLTVRSTNPEALKIFGKDVLSFYKFDGIRLFTEEEL